MELSVRAASGSDRAWSTGGTRRHRRCRRCRVTRGCSRGDVAHVRALARRRHGSVERAVGVVPPLRFTSPTCTPAPIQRRRVRFGASAAIVAGDLAFVWADDLLDQLECSPDRPRRACCLQPSAARGDRRAVSRSSPVHTVCERRAGADGGAAQIGSVHGHPSPATGCRGSVGAPAETHAALQQYGDAIGVAFQLRDDVLGVFGDPATTGKGRSKICAPRRQASCSFERSLLPLRHMPRSFASPR